MIKALLLTALVSANCHSGSAIVEDGPVLGKLYAVATKSVLIKDLPNDPKKWVAFSHCSFPREKHDDVTYYIRCAEFVGRHVFADFTIGRDRAKIREAFVGKNNIHFGPFISSEKTRSDVIGRSLSEIFQRNADHVYSFVKYYVSTLNGEICPQLLRANFLRNSHSVIRRPDSLTRSVEGFFEQPNRPSTNSQSQHASANHCPLCPSIPQNDVGVLLRIFITIFGATAIMFCAGFVSWGGNRWLDWRWLYGGLVGGLFLSGVWLYFWIIFIFLSF